MTGALGAADSDSGLQAGFAPNRPSRFGLALAHNLPGRPRSIRNGRRLDKFAYFAVFFALVCIRKR